jgi:sugar phosphate permease
MVTRKPGWKYRYNIVAVLFVAWGVAVLDRGAMPVALPYISRELGLKPFQSSLILSTFFVGYSLAHLPGGVLADRFGARKVATLSLLWWSAFTALTGAVSTLLQMLTVRLLFGLGEGASPGAFFKTIAVWFPKKERATATAVMFTANSIGAALSPLLVVAIMAIWGWRAVFLALLVPGVLTSLLFWKIVRDRPSDVGEMNVVDDGDSEAAQADPAPAHGKIAWKEILQPDIVKYFFSLLIFDIAYWGFQNWLPTYLVQVRGFSMMQMGAAASAPFLFGAFGRIIGGRLSDTIFRRQRRLLVALTQILSGVCLLLTFFAPTTWMMIVSQIAAGFFLSAYQSTFWALPMSTVSQERMGIASGFINMGGQIGGLISPLIIGALLEMFNGSFAAPGVFLEVSIFISTLIILSLPARSAEV